MPWGRKFELGALFTYDERIAEAAVDCDLPVATPA